MTSPRRARRDDGAGALGGTATLRGGLLIGAAVLLGVVLLGKGFDSGFLPSTSNDPSDRVASGGGDDEGEATGDDDADSATSTTAAVTHQPAAVRVQVLNGGGPPGSAGAATELLVGATFNAVDADDAAQDVAASIVYAAPGYEADAGVIAATLGIAGEIEPMPSPPPAPAPADLNVLVVVGPGFTVPTGQ